MSRACTAHRAAADGSADEIGRILAGLRAFLSELGPPPEDVRSLLVLGCVRPRGPEFALTSRSALVAHLRRQGDDGTAQALDAPVPAGAVRVVAVGSDGSYRTALAWWPSTAERINASGGCA
ncbi:hypothetical protein WMF45_33700 [Sorangium sp. So ce448]|uniref:hypothetical protein n=1 Tax=Sorangium sp. So ce448 TaxID=3133314 RepID=UPI003F6412BD